MFKNTGSTNDIVKVLSKKTGPYGAIGLHHKKAVYPTFFKESIRYLFPNDNPKIDNKAPSKPCEIYLPFLAKLKMTKETKQFTFLTFYENTSF